MDTYEFICKPENAVILQDFKCLVVLERLLKEYFDENQFLIGAPEEYAKWYPLYMELLDKCKVVNKKKLEGVERMETMEMVKDYLDLNNEWQPILNQIMKG